MADKKMLDAAEGFVDTDSVLRDPLNEGHTKHLAILRRGNVWFHKAIRFDKGVRVVISEEMYLWMEENAVDYVNADDREVTGKAKFEYIENYEGPEPIGASLDVFEDLDDDRLRRRDAYREPYRPPVKRIPGRVRTSRTEEALEVSPQIPMRTRTRVR